MAIKVKLREKTISGNRKSLYLDFYPAINHPETGELTRRQFLGMYILVDAKTRIDKQHNNDTLQLAELIRQKKENSLNKPEIYSAFEREQLKIKEKGQLSFLEYFKNTANSRRGSNLGNWISGYNYLDSFTNGNLNFGDISEQFCEEYKSFLMNVRSNRSAKASLAVNSSVSYFNKFKAVMRQAFKDGYFQTDINAKVSPIKQEETGRNFLTIEELNSLAITECELPTLKKAALFSALTGLRFSDIQKLDWGEIEYIKGNGYFIKFRQMKTKSYEMMPISEQAFKLLEKRTDGRVMPDLKYSAWTNHHLFKWLVKAGITKKITFHCFRHTYATLQLSLGTDIYTVSKMLGHRELKTTQIYGKVIDHAKRVAADKIKLNLLD